MSALSVTPAASEEAPGEAPALLFAEGVIGPRVDAFAERVGRLACEQIAPLHADAEDRLRFPRAAIDAVARSGMLAERWAAPGHGDLGRAVVMAEGFGNAGLGGLAVGLSVHIEAFTSIVRRFAATPALRQVAEQAIAGEAIGCLATSEAAHGSDVSRAETVAVSDGDGWHVRGVKRYVSLGARADFVLVLGNVQRPGRRDALGLFLIPADQVSVRRPYVPSGVRSLETVELAVDARIPAEWLLGRPGAGLLAATWGFTHERLAAAAQAVGAAQLALDLAVSHMRRRRQFGSALFDHQALRLRIASLAAQVDLARLGLRALAGARGQSELELTRGAAAAKVTAGRLAIEVIHECRHVFGGLGYLEDETPLPRLSRDAELARFGGGTDEMMWEVVAGGLTGDDRRYEAMIRDPAGR